MNEHGAQRSPLLVNRRELATILAALRYHQAENMQDAGDIADPAIANIATDDGMVMPLSDGEVDELCERLNLEQPAPVDVFADVIAERIPRPAEPECREQ